MANSTAPCVDCGKIRKVYISKGKPTRDRCQHCANVLNGKKTPSKFKGKENHPRWKNGITTHDGYVAVTIDKSDTYYPMVDRSGYVKRSRLVMAQHLGRCLLPSEQVHHLNGDITDDRIENLQVLSRSEHMKLHRTNPQCMAELRGEK